MLLVIIKKFFQELEWYLKPISPEWISALQTPQANIGTANPLYIIPVQFWKLWSSFCYLC